MCMSCHSTPVIPFRLVFQPGVPLYEQVVYAVKKAVAGGRLRPGDTFPSVRALSRELKINPNTAHKVVGALVEQGLLEVRPGIGTVVAAPPAATAAERRQLLREHVEALVVEAVQMGIPVEELVAAVEQQWRRLEAQPGKGKR